MKKRKAKNEKVPLILIIGASPKATGGIATWTREMLNYSNNSFRFKHIDASFGKKGPPKSQVFRAIKNVLRNFRIVLKVFLYSLFLKPKLVHSCTTSSPKALKREILLSKITNFFKIDYLVHFHCTIDEFLEGKKGYTRLVKLSNLAKAFFVLNKSSYKTMNNIKNKERDFKIFKVPNFITDTMVVDKKNIKQKIEKAIFISRVETKKGYYEYIELANAFLDIEFNIIGPLEEKINLKDLPKNVVYHGSKDIDYIFSALDKCDLFVFLTHYQEGFPMVLLEAMSRGVPCLCSNTPIVSEMLDERGGVLVDYKDNVEVFNAFANLIDNQNLRNDMSKFNINKVKTNYLKSIVLHNVFNCYNIIINSIY